MIYGPNVKIHMPGENKSILPPEAWEDPDAVHATVSGFDVYSSGLVLEKLLCHPKCTTPTKSQTLLWQAHKLKEAMLTKDPYKRPDAAYLLEHDEFIRSVG